MKDIYIYHHLGLGDSIACNGLVRHILEISDNTTNIFVFCKKNFFKIIKFMYRDQSRINLIPLENNIDEHTGKTLGRGKDPQYQTYIPY